MSELIFTLIQDYHSACTELRLKVMRQRGQDFKCWSPLWLFDGIWRSKAYPGSYYEAGSPGLGQPSSSPKMLHPGIMANSNKYVVRNS
jgi:hypothetical protein